MDRVVKLEDIAENKKATVDATIKTEVHRIESRLSDRRNTIDTRLSNVETFFRETTNQKWDDRQQY